MASQKNISRISYSHSHSLSLTSLLNSKQQKKKHRIKLKKIKIKEFNSPIALAFSACLIFCSAVMLSTNKANVT
jgi:hypothetical protein